jgi:cytochrome b6-f complex iron-sulfur subunit
MVIVAKVSAGQWVIIGLAAAIALAGFGLMMVNLAAIIRPRHAGEKGPPRKLVGPPQQVTRRTFFRRVLLAGFNLSMLGFGGASLAFLWPNLGGGFGGLITLGASIEQVKEKIDQDGQFYYAAGRFYLVPYNEADDKAGIYKKAGLLAGGMMALYQRCVHLGCRVPFCATSQWFECPCHGSKYNHAGEYKAGPAPRGLDRFPLEIVDGVIKVNTGIIVTGPPRGTNTTGQQPAGPFCVDPSRAAAE